MNGDCTDGKDEATCGGEPAGVVGRQKEGSSEATDEGDDANTSHQNVLREHVDPDRSATGDAEADDEGVGDGLQLGKPDALRPACPEEGGAGRL